MALHSRYDPAREAERYLDSVATAFDPLFIVVAEPGESWLIEPLRRKFPNARIIALRYTIDEFLDSDDSWDAVWRPQSAEGSLSVADFLFSLIPDETLPFTLFLPWRPSDRQWPEQSASVWTSIASLIRRQQDVMYTRNAFGKRWLSNMVKNSVLVENPTRLVVDRSVFLALAGPTLELNAPERGKYFVCAVSSAIAALAARGVQSDLYFATDGGYWANPLFRDANPETPIAFPLEAAIPSNVAARGRSIVLNYGSDLEGVFLSAVGVSGENARRNGTVAGTAALFFLERTSCPVYASGLDLSVTKSFTHARPHESLILADSISTRLDPFCGKLAERNLDGGALDAYAQWFSTLGGSVRGRFFRLEPATRALGAIETVREEDISRDVGSAAFFPIDRKDSTALKRAKSVAELLSVFADRIDSVSRAPRSDRIVAFSSALAKNVGLAELAQMVNYTCFLRAMQATRSRTEPKDATAVDDLCRDVLACLRRLVDKARMYGGT